MTYDEAREAILVNPDLAVWILDHRDQASDILDEVMR